MAGYWEKRDPWIAVRQPTAWTDTCVALTARYEIPRAVKQRNACRAAAMAEQGLRHKAVVNWQRAANRRKDAFWYRRAEQILPARDPD